MRFWFFWSKPQAAKWGNAIFGASALALNIKCWGSIHFIYSPRFSMVNLMAGYWQGQIDEQDKEKNCFHHRQKTPLAPDDAYVSAPTTLFTTSIIPWWHYCKYLYLFPPPSPFKKNSFRFRPKYKNLKPDSKNTEKVRDCPELENPTEGTKHFFGHVLTIDSLINSLIF